tara:strand:- start:1769 stop:2521 length:753 start_codon:yes stop_codon:yes gene_type:complete
MRYLLVIFFIISSCSSKKDILLLQDTNPKIDYNFEFKDIKIQSDDILRIKISSKSSDIASLYDTPQNFSRTGTILSYQIEGYLVNSKGFINIPTLDPILVKGLSLNEASNKIRNLLEKEEVLKSATVDVKILNAYFTVIGEVNSPGRYSFLENNINIFQALGIAGDLTINGKRNDVKILSKADGKMTVNSIDLTSSEILVSNNFQIFPGDIIIVNANSARVKNAGIVGNFGNLLSVMSFILSSIILISNN